MVLYIPGDAGFLPSTVTPPVFAPKASRKGNQKSHVLSMTSPPTLICTLFNGEKGWELQGPNVNIVDTCKFI